jgi:hypothetical protein
MFGSQVLMATSPAISEIGIVSPVRTIRYHAWSLMNAYQWKPFYSFDETQQQFDEVRLRLQSEVEK